ncbi:phosphate ABC transporter permease PstA [Mucilaginibacter aquariorum]|uniref:Phosphate transport system permease protein PstA n=1 Tax=Mucilaginibacter aquariorum TaxID=2967225 RepID=A0ABT1T2C9_9SPHI|nr:phosphate ABC transporter permease PstA [Mucilaginibacter aquariorum]MCQ6958749.1 phosphate ABC transporter permease PstA [Mucilaginibacter aquariorum]
MKRKLLEYLEWGSLLMSTTAVCFFLVVILWDLASKGAGSLSWDFVSRFPENGMTSGGILPAIIGTVMLTVITAITAAPFGICCAIYLHEYAPDTPVTRLIRASIRNLAGVPSVIFGLFGLACFVQALHLGTSLLSAGLTLGLLSLPYIIVTSEEALHRVPVSIREGAWALGATHFEMVRDIVVPSALPGIITGIILAVSRAAGETAPILFTGAAYYINNPSFSLDQEFMALPYHLYMLSTQHQSVDLVRPLAYSTALVLIIVVLLLNLTAFYIRYKSSKDHATA